MSENLIYKNTAIELLGLTANSFEKLGITPVKVVKNPHYKRAANAKLYDRLSIEKLIDSEKVKSLQPKPKKPVDYKFIFEKKYKHRNEALEQVCKSMFNLNRYCKYRSCSFYNREEIYNLKNKLIKHLYQNDLSSKVYLHSKPIDNTCYRCKGTGLFFEDGYLTVCYNCDGTGTYTDEKERKYYVFEFKINGVQYSWHQPDYIIDFEIREIVGSEEMNETLVQPLNMPVNSFKKAKELIKWYLNITP